MPPPAAHALGALAERQQPRRQLHLKFTVLRQAPDDAKITHGNSCERKALLDMVKKDEVIVSDRYNGLEYGYFGELKMRGASCVIRNKPRGLSWARPVTPSYSRPSASRRQSRP